jgi:hypothetical protein
MHCFNRPSLMAESRAKSRRLNAPDIPLGSRIRRLVDLHNLRRIDAEFVRQ